MTRRRDRHSGAPARLRRRVFVHDQHPPQPAARTGRYASSDVRMTDRYGIAEWFGEPFDALPAPRRQALARAALGRDDPPACPFQRGRPTCGKKGGVCSIRAGKGRPVITCPRRFEEDDLLPRWLAEIVGFDDVFLAREVPFMRSPATGRAAGRIDLVVAGDAARRCGSAWRCRPSISPGSGCRRISNCCSNTPRQPRRRRPPFVVPTGDRRAPSG